MRRKPSASAVSSPPLAAKLFAVVLLAPVLLGCGTSREPSDRQDAVTFEEVQAVLDRHREAWMALPEVQGAGIGRCDEEPCIRIFVTGDTAAVREEIPERVEGALVELEPTGPFRALDPPDTAGS